MKKNKRYALLIAETALCAILAVGLPPQAQGDGYFFIAQFPFAQIGRGLRSLSLSGAAGNALAFALYLALCAAPLAWVVLRALKKQIRAEDSLLAVLGVFSFYMMFLMVNPSYLSGSPVFSADGMVQAVLGGVYYSILIGYAVLRLLRQTNNASTDALLKFLRLLLGAMAAALVLNIFYMQLNDMIAQLHSIRAGNSDPSVSLGATYAFVGLRYVLTSLPDVLEIVLFLMAMDLCEKLVADRYGEPAVSAARRLAAYCAKMVVAVLLSCIAFNILQLVFTGVLFSVNFYTLLPLESVSLAFIMMLVARLLSDSRRMREDNELII